MSDLILHQYAESPFSEKIRALLAYKHVPYLNVDIPAIMPKPDLIKLTGGYRRTPVMQRGADIYCDTSLMARIIEDWHPERSVFGDTTDAQAVSAARWTDSEFFRACVGLVFQPLALAANPRFADPAAAEAFIKDRAAFTAGSGGLATPLHRAEAIFRDHMAAVDKAIIGNGFLAGPTPGIVDFATWHCCWFVHRQEVLRDYFAPFAAVQAWMSRFFAIDAGAKPKTLNAAQAIAQAREATPLDIRDAAIDPRLGLSAGQAVQVLPTDYGFQPVNGLLLAATDQRISISRQSPDAGELHIHFPRYGFDVSALPTDS